MLQPILSLHDRVLVTIFPNIITDVLSLGVIPCCSFRVDVGNVCPLFRLSFSDFTFPEFALVFVCLVSLSRSESCPDSHRDGLCDEQERSHLRSEHGMPSVSVDGAGIPEPDEARDEAPATGRVELK